MHFKILLSGGLISEVLAWLELFNRTKRKEERNSTLQKEKRRWFSSQVYRVDRLKPQDLYSLKFRSDNGENMNIHLQSDYNIFLVNEEIRKSKEKKKEQNSGDQC